MRKKRIKDFRIALLDETIGLGLTPESVSDHGQLIASVKLMWDVENI